MTITTVLTNDRPDPGDRAVASEPMARLAIAPAGRRRRNSELGLGFLAIVVTISAYITLSLVNGPKLPADLGVLLGGIVALYVIAHVAVRRLAPRADGTRCPSPRCSMASAS